MPSNDPIAASTMDGTELRLRSADGPLAFWNVYLGEVESHGDERGIAAAHRARVLDAFRSEGLLGLVRPNLTNEWHGLVSGSLSLAGDRRALVASGGGPVPGLDLQRLTSRLAIAVQATVSAYVDGMSEPWLASPLGDAPFEAFDRRLMSMEAVAAGRLLVSAGDARTARSLRRELAARGLGSQVVEADGRVGLSYAGEVELADQLRTRPLVTLSVDDDRIDLSLHRRRRLLSQQQPLWIMSWLSTDVGILDPSSTPLTGDALEACLAAQRRTWTRPETPLPPDVALALGLDEAGAARVQALLDADRPAVDAESVVAASGLPRAFGDALHRAIAGLPGR